MHNYWTKGLALHIARVKPTLRFQATVESEPPYTPPPTSPDRPKTSFFTLPRELRDMIYHYYWQTYHPSLPAPNTPFDWLTLQLRYQGVYTMSTTMQGYDTITCTSDDRYPTFLLANKQLLHEALEQFASKAEWFWDGHALPKRSATDRHSNLLGTWFDGIRKMTLHVGSFAAWEDANWWDDGSVCSVRDLRPLVRAVARAQSDCSISVSDGDGDGEEGKTGKRRIQRLRISGLSRMLRYYGAAEEFTHGKQIISKIMEMFKDDSFEVERLELEVFNQRPDRRRVLFEVKGRGADVKLVVREDERHEYRPTTKAWTEAQWQHFDCLERSGAFLTRW